MHRWRFVFRFFLNVQYIFLFLDSIKLSSVFFFFWSTNQCCTWQLNRKLAPYKISCQKHTLLCTLQLVIRRGEVDGLHSEVTRYSDTWIPIKAATHYGHFIYSYSVYTYCAYCSILFIFRDQLGGV